jgi:DNA-binding CsgD family transcriptional regulator
MQEREIAVMDRARRVVRPKPLPQVPPQPAPLSSPGVLILGITRELLYMTLSAHKFLADLDGLRDASWDGTPLPLAVQHVCAELQHDGKQDSGGTDWDKVQVRHLARTAHSTILIRGYCIFQHHGAQTGRFLILFETVPTASSVHDNHEETDWQFTARQRGIVNGLVLGLSNKEIAESLLISVHTVKEYIRQLMMKLHTTSRTGIVARVAGLTLPSPKASGLLRSPDAPAAAQVV